MSEKTKTVTLSTLESRGLLYAIAEATLRYASVYKTTIDGVRTDVVR